MCIEIIIARVSQCWTMVHVENFNSFVANGELLYLMRWDVMMFLLYLAFVSSHLPRIRLYLKKTLQTTTCTTNTNFIDNNIINISDA